MLQELTYVAPLRMPIAVGATTPDPGQPCVVWSTSVGALIYWTGTSWQPLSLAGAQSNLLLAADFSSTATAPAAVPGWAANVLAGKSYAVGIIAGYQTAALTTGGRLGLHLSSGTGSLRGQAAATITQAAGGTCVEAPLWAIGAIGLAGSNMVSTAVSVINSPHSFMVRAIFSCITSGVLAVNWASEVAASAAQLNQNSLFSVQQLN
jgi:hypothetical protein